jgi:hypothetical protein
MTVQGTKYWADSKYRGISSQTANTFNEQQIEGKYMDIKITKDFAGKATPITGGRHSIGAGIANPKGPDSKAPSIKYHQGPDVYTLMSASVPYACQAKIQEEHTASLRLKQLRMPASIRHWYRAIQRYTSGRFTRILGPGGPGITNTIDVRSVVSNSYA